MKQLIQRRNLVAVLFVLAAVSQARSFAPAPAPAQREIGSNRQASRGAVPLATGGDQAAQLPCNAGTRGGAVGGYQPVTDQGDLSSIQKDLAPLAFQKFVSANSVTGCMAGTIKPVSYNITKACEQVVAGTNYAFQFGTSFDCTTPSNGAAFGSVILNCLVFQPLPSSGQNVQPQVNKVWNVTAA